MISRLSLAERSLAKQSAGSCLRPGVPKALTNARLPMPSAAPAAPFSAVLRVKRDSPVNEPSPAAITRIVARGPGRGKGFHREVLVSQRNPRHHVPMPERTAALDDVSKAIIEQLQ